MANTAKKTESSIKQFVVTALRSKSGGESLWSQVWYPKNPMGLGFPFRWVLERTDDGVRVRDLGEKVGQVMSSTLKEFSVADLEKPIEIDSGLWLRIEPVMVWNQITESVGHWKPEPIRGTWGSQDDGREFRKSLIGVFATFVTCMIVITVLPKPQENKEELIPAQFAKVILAPKKVKPVDARSSGAKGGTKNVVQAFQSTEVKKTTSALFSSGAAKALLNSAKSMNFAGAAAKVNQVFGKHSSLRGQFNEAEGNTLDPRASKVGVIGGGGGGGKGNGTGVGYGDGAGAGVAGQGNGMVGLNEGGVGIDEGLTKDEVGRVIRQHLNEVRYCYESAMMRNPGLEGKVLVGFVVAANGRVKSAETKESSGDSGLDKCIISHLVKWQFPKPRGGVDVGVSYPFIFKSLSN